MRWSQLWEAAGAAVLTGTLLPACGCGLAGKLSQAGLGRERLVVADSAAGPVTGAYLDEENGRLAIRYRVMFRGEGTSLWLCVSKADIARRPRDRAVFSRHDGQSVLEIADGFRERLVSSRPRWNTADMVRLEPVEVASPADLPEGGYLGVQRPADGTVGSYRVCCRLDVDGTPEQDVLVVALPERRRRSGSGRALQLLLPLAAVLDAAGAIYENCPEVAEVALEIMLLRH